MSATNSLAQDHPTETQVEAAYLFSFGKFVTWPAADHPAGSFEICVIGKDPFGETLDATVNGESIDRKPVKLLRITRVQEADACNILYISLSEEAHLPGIVTDAQKFHLLTVSNITHFAERGGTIGLVRQNDRVRFEVNRATAERSDLVLSSELLKVAVKVIEKAPGK